MSLTEYDFELPEELIALRPERPRRAARLLVWDRGAISHRSVSDLADILQPDDHLVFNDTKVIPAALNGVRIRAGQDGGAARVSINLDQVLSDGVWRALARPARRLRAGDEIRFGVDFNARVLERKEENFVLHFNYLGEELNRRLEVSGQVPLPAYIGARREVDELDREDYQTVFARRPGAVAAPTASLHFDAWLLDRLRQRGIGHSTITLHVGAGTFLPVRNDDVSRHRMHSEWGEVSEAAAEEINAARKGRGRIVPVGTTALRLLETASTGGEVRAWRGDTDLFIRPGFRFSIADGLMTNFHLPKSTLLLLVAAVIGKEEMHRVYRTAMEARYRFFSYGDGSLLLP